MNTFVDLKKTLLNGVEEELFRASIEGILDCCFGIGKQEGFIDENKTETNTLSKEEQKYLVDFYAKSFCFTSFTNDNTSIILT